MNESSAYTIDWKKMIDIMLVDKAFESFPQDYIDELKTTSKKMKPASTFTIKVVENGYMISFAGNVFVYNSIDDIIDSFMKDHPAKPTERFE